MAAHHPKINMSYSVNFVGVAGAVADALTAQSEKMSGPSRDEYDKALPHIVGIVKQNYAAAGQPAPVLKVAAYGSATTSAGEVISSTCSVHVEIIHGFVQ